MERLVRAAVRDHTADESKKLSETLTHLLYKTSYFTMKTTDYERLWITKRSARSAANVLTCSARSCTTVVLLSGCRTRSTKPELVSLKSNNNRRLR
jgi:hypothetical protein